METKEKDAESPCVIQDLPGTTPLTPNPKSSFPDVECAEEERSMFYQYSDERVRDQGFGGKSPVSLLVGEGEYALEGNWWNLLVKTVDVLCSIDRDKLINVVKNFSGRCFSMSDEGMYRPYWHSASGVCVERNYSSTDCVYNSRKLFLLCGVSLENIGVVFVDKTTANRIAPGRRKNIEDEESHAPVLEKDIRENYTSGFDFSESAKRLVEERTGCPFSKATIHALQEMMFERRDGLWFFEDQISDARHRAEIVEQCQQWLAGNPIVNLTQFVELVGRDSVNLEDDFDKSKYAEYAICRSEFGRSCDFYGKRGGRFCFLAEVGVENSKKAFAKKVEELLRDRFDMIPVAELADLFPMVNPDWMIGNLMELIPDAILEDLGGKSYAFKLLEFYYLPDDFTEVFQSVTDALVNEEEALSVSRILGVLGDRYGCDFKEYFALTDTTFKQIATRVDREHRDWVNGVFGGSVDEEEKQLSFSEIVEREFPRVFSYEEFYQFGAKTRGWSEKHLTWHHRQLWSSFIRYDADHWSPVDYFKTATGWNDEFEEKISGALLSLLGTSLFFSLNKVPPQFLDTLPELKLEGRPVRWTLELLASIAYFCLPCIRVLNHARTPYTITSLLVPSDVAENTDEVAYMVQVFKLRNPYPPGGNFGDVAYQEMAMKFLLENDVRQRESQKLQLEVAELLR